MKLVFLRNIRLSITLLIGIAWIVGSRCCYRRKLTLPLWFRLSFRRWLVRRKRAHCGDRWPILESAGVTSPEWYGLLDKRQFAFVLTHDVESQRSVDRVRQLAEVEMALGFRRQILATLTVDKQAQNSKRHLADAEEQTRGKKSERETNPSGSD